MILSRPHRDIANLMTAATIAHRGSCRRRRVGCLLVDRNNYILSSGYNGREARVEECLTDPCEAALMPSGTHLDLCEAIHAEANALLKCRDPMQVDTLYCTTAPCTSCLKLIQGTSCRRIIFAFDYPQAEDSRKRWEKGSERRWIHLPYRQQIEDLWKFLDSI